jgi:hypothetical protein
MKIIISKTFNKKYLQKLSKYFSTEELVNKLKNKETNICLKYPHFKIKLKIGLVEFRWIILIKDNKYIIPIVICLKKDKNCWENIMWSKYEKQALNIQEKVFIDIQNKDYEAY